MKQKDKSKKYLESYNYVFADIFNVLLFHKGVIHQYALHDSATETVYKTADSTLSIHQRDIMKVYHDMPLTIAAFGIENQSIIDKDMPIRVMGYDYTEYRRQITSEEKRHPVITIVLNFSDKKWSKPKSLFDVLDIPNEIKPYVQNYRIHVFNIAFLTKKIRNQFKSDFKIVADFFTQKRKKNYKPSKEKIIHVEAVLQLLEVFTGDKRYNEMKEEVVNLATKTGGITMCEVLDFYTNKGINEGIAIGKERGIAIGEKRGMVLAYYDMNFSTGEIARKTHLSEAKIQEIINENTQNNE